MSEQRASVPPSIEPDILGADFAAGRDLLMRRFRAQVRHDISAQIAAGYTIYSCGTGDQAGQLFMHTPDGRRFEYRLRADGTREIVRELPR